MTGSRRLLLAGFATAGVLVACGAYQAASSFRSQESVPVFVVQKTTLRRTVNAEGNLKAVEATPLIAPGADLDFKIAWLADDGSRVKKGQTIIRFDSTDTEKSLFLGQADRGKASGQASKERAESGAVLTGLSRDAEQYRRELVAATTFQSKDPEIFTRHQIIEADIDVDLAGVRETNALTSRTKRGKLSQTNLDLFAIDGKKAGFKIDRASLQMAQLEVKAPYDGLVVFQRDWKGDLPQIGQSVWSGFKLGELPDLTVMEAEIFVLEADAGGLVAGKKATVVIESHPDSPVSATVKKVDSLPKPRVKGVPVQYFGATLELARTDPAVMKPGQRVQALVVLGEERDVLVIPRQAVFEKDGKKVVYQKKGKRFESVPVTLGTLGLARVVVSKGISEGAVIALSDPTGASARKDQKPVAKTAGPLG
ncbi:MAG: efflux RND transporter periplasmic adaptor subunit [Thermoanaerobaculia bacterium]